MENIKTKLIGLFKRSNPKPRYRIAQFGNGNWGAYDSYLKEFLSVEAPETMSWGKHYSSGYIQRYCQFATRSSAELAISKRVAYESGKTWSFVD